MASRDSEVDLLHKKSIDHRVPTLTDKLAILGAVLPNRVLSKSRRTTWSGQLVSSYLPPHVSRYGSVRPKWFQKRQCWIN